MYIASYWMQIIPLQWQMLQKVNCDNALGKIYKIFMGINVTKWSWENYYKNACVNKISKIYLLYWDVNYKLLNLKWITLFFVITNWMCLLTSCCNLSYWMCMVQVFKVKCTTSITIFYFVVSRILHSNSRLVFAKITREKYSQIN
jgi:hypothetical protein